MNGTDHWILNFNSNAICGLHWNPSPSATSVSDMNDSPIATKAKQELEEYLLGQRKNFSIPLVLKGTPFQLQVWNALLTIPYGETVSYLEIARRIGKPKAVRAVGSAIGKNPICILIPCHRVIAADGSIGGYSGGVETKIKLLELESGVKSRSITRAQPSTG